MLSTLIKEGFHETDKQKLPMDCADDPLCRYSYFILLEYDLCRPCRGYIREIPDQRGTAGGDLHHRRPAGRFLKHRGRACAGPEGGQAVRVPGIDLDGGLYGLSDLCKKLYGAFDRHGPDRRVPPADHHRGAQDGGRCLPPGADAPGHGGVRLRRRLGDHPGLCHR